MWVIDGKCRSLLANMGDSACMGEPLIIVTASSILDVGRGPGAVSDIFCINYTVFHFLYDGERQKNESEARLVTTKTHKNSNTDHT